MWFKESCLQGTTGMWFKESWEKSSNSNALLSKKIGEVSFPFETECLWTSQWNGYCVNSHIYLLDLDIRCFVPIYLPGAELFSNIQIINLPRNTIKAVLLNPLYRERNWGTAKLSSWLQVTKLIDGANRM